MSDFTAQALKSVENIGQLRKRHERPHALDWVNRVDGGDHGVENMHGCGGTTGLVSALGAPPPLTLWPLCPHTSSRRGGWSRWCRTGTSPSRCTCGGVPVSPHRMTRGDVFMNAACDDCVVGEAVVPTARLQHPHRASSQRRHELLLLHLHPACKPPPCPHTFRSQSRWRRHAAPQPPHQ